MNRKELDKYKKLLIKERMSIMGGVNQIAENTLKKSQRDASGDLSGYSLHMADMATDNYDREFLLTIADSERETLLKIDEALKRVEDKSYGKCQTCSKSILKRRLGAVPYAENCKACQEKEESEKRA